jgi:hypothetical protein
VHHFFPDNNTSYDMTVWQERGTGGAADRAYLVRSCPVMRIAVSRLRPDWLATEGSLCSTVSFLVSVWAGRDDSPFLPPQHEVRCVMHAVRPKHFRLKFGLHIHHPCLLNRPCYVLCLSLRTPAPTAPLAVPIN